MNTTILKEIILLVRLKDLLFSGPMWFEYTKRWPWQSCFWSIFDFKADILFEIDAIRNTVYFLNVHHQNSSPRLFICSVTAIINRIVVCLEHAHKFQVSFKFRHSLLESTFDNLFF